MITALLVTALAVTLVSGMLWQQQVFVRTMEGQRMHLRASLLGRGALEEVRMMLRDGGSVTTLDGNWSLPLRDIAVDSDATLSGSVIDAQSRFNLRNLAPRGITNPYQVAAFARLLATLGLEPALARKIGAAFAGGAAALAPRQCDDLLAVPGITAQTLDRLRDYVTVLPEATAVNVNTASAQVLTAVANLSLKDAQALVAQRRQAHFKDNADFAFRLNDKETLEGVQFDVSSSYFLVASTVQIDGICMQTLALMQRQRGRGVALRWLRTPWFY